MVCLFLRYEAQKQLDRDRIVETQLINLLRERAEDCMYYETYMAKEVHDPTTKCGELKVIRWKTVLGTHGKVVDYSFFSITERLRDRSGKLLYQVR